MKPLITSSLFVILSFLLNAQPDCQASRPALNIAAQIWQQSYLELRENGYIDSDSSMDIVSFSRKNLDLLRKTPEGPEIAIFRYYLEEEDQKIPRIAIRSAKDSTKYLLDNGGFVHLDSLRRKFAQWDDFLKTSSIFFYVREYHICWSQVNEILDRKIDSDLFVQHVAKVISPADDRYDHDSVDENYVGYIAFDLLLTFQGDPILSDDNEVSELDLGYYNFASPCPKMCHCIDVVERCPK